MIEDGATIIDVGAMSSKPGSEIISASEEINRLKIPVENILKEFPNTIFSIDTVNSETANYCLDKGFSIVNDISAGEIDSQMFSVLKKYDSTYIAMHMKGIPSNMQSLTEYDNVVEEVYSYFEKKIVQLSLFNFHNIILDVGFGFAKTVEQNFELLKNLNHFQSLGKPILAGLSRKSMICKILEVSPNDALNGTTALNMIALQNGATILRVHDVKEAVECVKLYEKIK
jgi:dihydropteroate synthase